MTTYLSPCLDHPAYYLRFKLRNFNYRLAATSAPLAKDGARILLRANPKWSREDHQNLALAHRAESQRLEALHTQLLDQAHMATFGAPRCFTDYKVACIGRQEYPQQLKEGLRKAGYGSTAHAALANAHSDAAKLCTAH